MMAIISPFFSFFFIFLLEIFILEVPYQFLEEVLKVDPLNGNALILLGEYYQNQGDFETALHYFERAVALPDFQREAQLQMARIYVRQREYRKAIRELEEAQQLEYSSNVQDFLDAVRSAYNRSL